MSYEQTNNRRPKRQGAKISKFQEGVSAREGESLTGWLLIDRFACRRLAIVPIAKSIALHVTNTTTTTKRLTFERARQSKELWHHLEGAKV